METILHNISINHFFIGLFYLHDLLLNLGFKYIVKIRIGTLSLFFPKLLFLLNALVHKHLKS
jgi:hypothetical protein